MTQDDKVQYTQLVKTLDEMPTNLRCSSCRTKKKPNSGIWYQCQQSGCDLVYCDKQRCYEDAAQDHHDNMEEEEGECPHKYIRTPIRMQLTLPDDSVKTNVNEIIGMQKKLKSMGVSESNRNLKNMMVSTTMVIGQGISTLAKVPITDTAGPIAKFLVKSSNQISGGTCGVLTAVGAGLDLGITCYRFFSGEIKEWGEFGKELLKKSVKHATTFGIVYGTTKLFMSAGVAFGGPIGALVGGVIGFGVGYAFDKLFDRVWPSNDEKNAASQKILQDALKRFGYKPNDIYNPKIFNKIVIQKKYRSYARECHPDSKMGKNLTDAKERFIELNAHFGVLIGIVDRLSGKNTDTKDKNKFKQQLAIMCSGF